MTVAVIITIIMIITNINAIANILVCTKRKKSVRFVHVVSVQVEYKPIQLHTQSSPPFPESKLGLVPHLTETTTGFTKAVIGTLILEAQNRNSIISMHIVKSIPTSFQIILAKSWKYRRHMILSNGNGRGSGKGCINICGHISLYIHAIMLVLFSKGC